MGKPCIASDIPGIAKPFEGVEGCEVIDPSTDDEYREVIDRLVAGEVRVDVDTVNERFDIRRNYERLAEIHHESLARKAGS